MASIADMKALLDLEDKSSVAVTRITAPRGGDVYLFRSNGGIGVR